MHNKPLRRFFTEPQHIDRETAIITEPDAKHIRQVLRLGINEQIEIIDGTGTVYLTEIQAINKNTVKTHILQSYTFKPAPPLLFVAQAMLKGKKMDFLFQKLNELSVEGLYSFHSEFSEARSREDKQLERWQRIALESCKQCKRPIAMHCFPTTSFDVLLANSADFTTKILCWEKESDMFLSSIPERLTNGGSTLIVLGPEGGFSNAEVEKARTYGFTTVSLGPRILRAETATMAAASILQYQLGSFNHTDTFRWEGTA